MTPLVCHDVVQAAAIHKPPLDHVALGYDARLVRRKRLTSAAGVTFLLDLPATVSLQHGDAFVLSDGSVIGVIAAAEPLMQLRGDLARIAWHIGNRHAPCQIEPGRMLIQRDKVLRAMLEGLGAQVTDVTEPFMPEGGAYGHGRTMGHDHSHSHSHSHCHDGDHGHSHSHDHDHHHDG